MNIIVYQHKEDPKMFRSVLKNKDEPISEASWHKICVSPITNYLSCYCGINSDVILF